VHNLITNADSSTRGTEGTVMTDDWVMRWLSLTQVR